MKSLTKVCGKDIRVEGRLVRIGRLDADKYQFLEDPETFLEELRKSRDRIDLFTFMQKLPETTPKYTYPMEWDNFAAVPVSTFEHWWTKQIHSFPRNRARQAKKKGVTLREVPFDDALVKGIWEIYNECPVRQGRAFSHYGKDLETVRREEATYLSSSVFIGAFLDDKLIGFIKLTWNETRTQANLMNILSMIQHRDKAPTNALIAEAVRFCAEHGISFLVYQNFSGSKKQDSLSKFKENNGFHRIDVPRYYVPLTHLGWIALRLGFHHPLVDHVPEPVLAKLREIRSAWYNRKLKISTEES
jgi:hypothetical protein